MVTAEKMARMQLRSEVEDFLYHEAALLDSLAFEEWFALFDQDGEYLVPSTDVPAAAPGEALFLIHDEYERLRGRVTRLQSRDAHADYPHPRTRRVISNVRCERTSEGEVSVRAAFIVYSLRVGKIHCFMGEYDYLLREHEDTFHIVRKRANLDLESLEPAGGKVNIIV